MTPLLTLVQWLSPSFPTGAFAYSHGLETVIFQGVVHDSRSLGTWLQEVLGHGAGWQDAVLLAQALTPEADPEALDELARALAPSAERLAETLEQGAALVRTLTAMGHPPQPPRALPVALGVAARDLGLPPETVISLFLHSFVGNLCTIAVRHVPLGQSEGQALLASLSPKIADLATRAAQANLDDLGGCALAADLAAMTHETLDIRIFRT